MNNTNSIVRVINDGTIGEVVWSDAAEVQVVHADYVAGRGPWYLPAEQVTPASAEEATAYQARCEAR